MTQIKTSEYEIEGHKQFHKEYKSPIGVIGNIDAYPLSYEFVL